MIEQYFFTENVINNLVEKLQHEDDILSLCTPVIADGFFRLKEMVLTCLDIDERFDYLPWYVEYDILNPKALHFKPKVIIVDPPFFGINLVDLYNCIDVLTKGDKTTKIIILFVSREEPSLFVVFKPYNIKCTKFKLEYQSVLDGMIMEYIVIINLVK